MVYLDERNRTFPAPRDQPLLNDTLLAASCHERGITLSTQDSDFDRFAVMLKGWRHVPPWPEVAH